MRRRALPSCSSTPSRSASAFRSSAAVRRGNFSHVSVARDPGGNFMPEPPPCPSPTRGEGTGGETPAKHLGRNCGHGIERRTRRELLPPPLWGRDGEGGSNMHHH